MQASRLLQKFLEKSCVIHKKRIEVLVVAAETLVRCCRLSVVGLGRGLKNQVKTKHNINRMDRLIGNNHLYNESIEIYKANAQMLIGNKIRPIIVVDWSSATVAERYQLLRAGVAAEGRTLTIYEEVHELKKYNNPKVHKEFVKNLQKVLPKKCRPIIVTDAGFGIAWFKEILSHGWDYVGRVINKSHYSEDGNSWEPILELLKYKRAVIKRIGEVILSKEHKFKCYLQVYKGKKKNRIKKNEHGERAGRRTSVICARRGRQPWILASSLGKSKTIAKNINKIYASRMQIEESFRDIKSTRYGFSLRYCRSMGIKRLTNIFIIGLLGTLIAWIMGLCVKKRKIHYTLQTNSIKNRNVLSVFYIGCQIIKYPIRFAKTELNCAVKQINESIYVY